MIKIKNLLTILTAAGLVAPAASMVTSCGVGLNSLETRSIDTSIYKSTYTNAIQNWNLAATMQSADIKIIANTQDSLLTYVGQRTDTEHSLTPQPQIASKVSATGNTVVLKVNDNAWWYKNVTGEKVRKITATDIQNTAKYTLDPANASELSGDWETLVKGASDYNQKIGEAEQNYRDGKMTASQLDQTKKDDFKNILEPNVSVNGNQITFISNEPADIFITALETGSFAPTPAEALTMGFDYGRRDYKDVLVSGPYYVESYKPSNLIRLKRNPNYDDPNKGTINEIDYYFSSTSDVASQRRAWETGDVTEAMISPSDTYGTKKYSSLSKDLGTVKNNQVGSKSLWFNFSKQDKNGTPDKQSNEALSFDSVRTLIAYGMDRKRLVKYFAGPNGDGNVNDYLVNTFNPAGYLYNGDKEYVNDYLANDFSNNKKSLTSGDAYYENDALLNNKYNDLNDLINHVKSDLKSVGLSKANLTFLVSGVNATTFNPYILQMIRAFNEIPNNPIQITMDQTNGDSDYQSAQIEGNFSMFITGESPTFLDPISFLNNLYINGTMSLYMGTSRLFDNDGNVIKYHDDKDKPEKVTGDALTKYGVNQQLVNDMQDFTNKVSNADKKTDISTRYTDMAKAEADVLYNYKIVMPLYIPNGKEINYVSYVDNSTRPNIGYGYNDLRLDKVKLFKQVKEYLNDKNKVQTQAILNKQD